VEDARDADPYAPHYQKMGCLEVGAEKQQWKIEI
jgi:hypothetical protein